MNDKQIAMKVLDYWYSIEFLGQESYKTSTEESKIQEGFNKFIKSNSESKDKRQQILCFDNIDGSTDIPSIIYKKAKFCNMSTWGNLTFYIGKIKRQTCIYKLASYLNSEYTPVETSSEYISLLSFQCDNSGVYIKNSLSLSTILWALSQLPDNKGRQLSDILSEEIYIKELKNLEEKFFGGKIIQDPDLSDPDDENASAETMPVFSIDAVSVETLKMICNEIEKIYEGFFQKGDIEPKIGIKYQLFKNSIAKNRYYENNYSGLSNNYYSADLKMVKDAIAEENNANRSSLLSDLIAYICAPSSPHQFEERSDFIHPASQAELFKVLSQILNAGNAPLGKWPSKFMPSLMQQTAINLAISNRKRGIFAVD